MGAGERVPTPRESIGELRRDMVSGSLVLVNPARSGRPTTVARKALHDSNPTANGSGDVADCPFCWGNEASTAEEIMRAGPGAPGAPGWRVRVVRNRYPVLSPMEGAASTCEVVVFRSHHRRLEDMDVEEVAEILSIVRDRVARHARAGVPSVQVFVNAEAEAGASIAHPHAQIIGLDFEPPALDLEFAMRGRLGSDPLDLDLDLAAEHDLVVIGGEIPAWCPWGFAHPFGVRIAPRVAGTAFVDLDSTAVAMLAHTLRDVLRTVNDVLDRPAYNVVIFGDHVREGLVRRWRVEVVPRLNIGGGFEIGTGVTTHSTDTVPAADALRRHLAQLSTL